MAIEPTAADPIISESAILSKLGYVPWESEPDAGPGGLLDHTTYKYVAFPHEASSTPAKIAASPVFNAFMQYAEGNPQLTAQRFQRIICGPDPEANLKAFAFMSTASKQWRDDYLRLMVDEGEMEAGWCFVKDRNWQGYLRTDLSLGNIYEDSRAMKAASKRKAREEEEQEEAEESEESMGKGKGKGKAKAKGSAAGRRSSRRRVVKD